MSSRAISNSSVLSVEAMDADRFHALDYDFHGLICAVADLQFAYKTIADNKAHVDRLCMLSLSTKEGLAGNL